MDSAEPSRRDNKVSQTIYPDVHDFFNGDSDRYIMR